MRRLLAPVPLLVVASAGVPLLLAPWLDYASLAFGWRVAVSMAVVLPLYLLAVWGLDR